jgi:hypothetical protein
MHFHQFFLTLYNIGRKDWCKETTGKLIFKTHAKFKDSSGSDLFNTDA